MTMAESITHNGRFLKTMISASGVSIISQAINFFRQILIAAYFGVSRELDIFFMTFSMATFVVFTFGMIFDTVGIPSLVKILEEKGQEAFRRLTGSIFSFSIMISFGVVILFIFMVPILAQVMAAGFSTVEKKEIWRMAFFFVPWAFISLPYYALCSFYKSRRSFNLVFVGEIIISIVSVCALMLYHPNTNVIPISYFIGYLSAFMFLFAISFRYFDRIGTLVSEEIKKVYRNFLELFGTNQIGSISSIVEKFLQSFIQAGGISALAYSQQITTAASGFLGFREMFVVPLSSTVGRTKKLERLLIGLIVITIPIMAFLFYHTREIMTILFQRGKFDAYALDITSSVFSIYILALLPSVAGLPLFRMFQVIDRIRYTSIVYAFAIINFAVIGGGLIFLLKMGAQGIALTVVINSYLSSIISLILLRRGGIDLDGRRVFKYAGYVGMSSMVMIGITNMLPDMSLSAFVKLFIHGCIYMVLIIVAYLPIRKKIINIVNG